MNDEEIYKQIKKTIKDPSEYGVARDFAKLADAMDLEDKTRFYLYSREFDPTAKAFNYGHVATSSAVSFLAIGAGAIAEHYLSPYAVRGSAPFVALLLTGAASFARGAHDCKYRAMDVEYVDWRLGRKGTGEIRPIYAFGAGMLNGLKHNAITLAMRAVGCIICGGGVVTSWVGARLSKYTLGSTELSKTTRRAEKMKAWFEDKVIATIGITNNADERAHYNTEPRLLKKYGGQQTQTAAQPA